MEKPLRITVPRHSAERLQEIRWKIVEVRGGMVVMEKNFDVMIAWELTLDAIEKYKHDATNRPED